MTKTAKPPIKAYEVPPHPGKIIRKELLEPQKIKIGDAARILGVDRGGFSFLLNGHYGLSPEMAIKISEKFKKYSAKQLLSFQNDWDLAQARKKMFSKKKLTENPHPIPA
ncbi:MAG: HigA family addiction module antitoxin [Nitrospinales bacterium]